MDLARRRPLDHQVILDKSNAQGTSRCPPPTECGVPAHLLIAPEHAFDLLQ